MSASHIVPSVQSGYRVDFVDVGGQRMSWSQTSTIWPDEAAILKMVRARRALASREVDCITDDNGAGWLVAGIRKVGTYQVVPL